MSLLIAHWTYYEHRRNIGNLSFPVRSICVTGVHVPGDSHVLASSWPGALFPLIKYLLLPKLRYYLCASDNRTRYFPPPPPRYSFGFENSLDITPFGSLEIKPLSKSCVSRTTDS